jgi:gluconolactonase
MASEAEGVPDGMKVHPTGHVFCTGPAGVWLFAPDGRHLGTLAPPEVPANCCFRPGYESLVLTARTSVYEVELRGLNLT